MKRLRMSWITLVLLITCPSGLNAQQPPPQYTKEQIEELKKQNERAQARTNALSPQDLRAVSVTETGVGGPSGRIGHRQ